MTFPNLYGPPTEPAGQIADQRARRVIRDSTQKRTFA